MVMLIFPVFNWNYRFFGNLFQKSKLFVEIEIRTLINSSMQTSMVIPILFFHQKYPFWVNLVQKLKRVSLERKLVPGLIFKILW